MTALGPAEIAILQESFSGDSSFYANNLATVTALASRAGVHRNTASKAFARLRRRRFLLPWILDANGDWIGICRARAVLTGPSPWRNQAWMRTLLAIDEVKGINEYGDQWGVVIYGQDESDLRRRLDLVCATSGSSIAGFDYFIVPPKSRSPTDLTPRQLRVLWQTVGREAADTASIAKGLACSVRTIRRELDYLVRGGVLVLHFGGEANWPGIEVGIVTIESSNHPWNEIVDEIGPIGPHLVMQQRVPPKHHVVFVAPSQEAIRSLAAKIRNRFPGTEATWKPWTRRVLNPAFFDWQRRLIERRANVLAATLAKGRGTRARPRTPSAGARPA